MHIFVRDYLYSNLNEIMGLKGGKGPWWSALGPPGVLCKCQEMILKGGWDAKVGDQQDGEEGVVGCHALHGECGTSVCACVWNVRWNVCELCKSVSLHKRVTFPLHLSAVE